MTPTKRTSIMTLDEVASATGLTRQVCANAERRALAKIINAILSDEKIRQRYSGCLVDISRHTCIELNITLQLWVKLADKDIVRKYWTI